LSVFAIIAIVPARHAVSQSTQYVRSRYVMSNHQMWANGQRKTIVELLQFPRPLKKIMFARIFFLAGEGQFADQCFY
jgi:hypothetical protein